MPKYEGEDHYRYKGTGVLKNKLGLTVENALLIAEANFTTIRIVELSNRHIKGNFDLAHLKAIHKYLFQDIYAWAGKIRDIDLSKSGTYFANHNHIVSSANALFHKLANENCLSGLPDKQFSARAAYYLGEINAIHPFREGNGRAQREFINHLSYKNGCYIDWKDVSQQDMLQASIESFHLTDTTKLCSLIFLNLRKLP